MTNTTKVFSFLFSTLTLFGISSLVEAAPKAAPTATVAKHQSLQVSANRDGTTTIKMQPTASSPTLKCALRPGTQRAPSCDLCNGPDCRPLPTEIEICNNDGWCVGCGDIREGLGCWISSPGGGQCGVVTYESGTWSGCA